MELRDLINFVILVVALQGGFGIILFFLIRGEPGVDFKSIGISTGLLILISSVIGVSLYWLINRYMKERAIQTAIMTMTDDEEKVLRIIMDQGEARQDKLRKKLDFSKSKLSALLNNLEEKDAIKKTRYKRTNKIRPTEEFQR